MSDKFQENRIATQDKGAPLKVERFFSRIMLFAEDIIKIPLFKCQHCGECILSHTAFICSQRCPKRLRNGPCGGTGDNGSCEVFPERKCIWYRIYNRSKFLRRIQLLKRNEYMHNWKLEKTSAWLNIFKKRIEPPKLFFRDRERQENEF